MLNEFVISVIEVVVVVVLFISFLLLLLFFFLLVLNGRFFMFNISKVISFLCWRVSEILFLIVDLKLLKIDYYSKFC